MSTTLNGQTIPDLYQHVNGYTSYFDTYGTNYVVPLDLAMHINGCTETDNDITFTINVQVLADGLYRTDGSFLSTTSHTGNGLRTHPYYTFLDKNDSGNLVYRETVWAMEQYAFVVFSWRSSNRPGGACSSADQGIYNLYTNRTITIPKTSEEQYINLGCYFDGIFMNSLNANDSWDWNTSGWPGGYYSMFLANNYNSDPGYIEPANSWFQYDLNKDGNGNITYITIPAKSEGKIWYYDTNGIPHKGQAYYYDENGTPRKAKAVYYYDSNGVPHKAK